MKERFRVFVSLRGNALYMTSRDPIADLITRIKNAGDAGREFVTVPYSKLKMDIAEVLQKEKFLSDVKTHGRKMEKEIEIAIAYTEDKKPRVNGVRRVSKLSRRVYLGAQDIHAVKQGYGLLVLSTPDGVMTGSEAKKKGIGGEALFEIW